MLAWLKRILGITPKPTPVLVPEKQAEKPATPSPVTPPATKDDERKPPPWYVFAQQFKGKKETDPEFAAYMVPKWKLVGEKLGTIAQSWAAWCGLAMAVALSGAGLTYMKNGGSARAWATYGQAIDYKKDGIPQGAIIHLNHAGNCKSDSNNHVSQANGDCAPADLAKPGAMVDMYGGNQSNTWKVSTYSVKEICEVRWPKEVAKPPPITKSRNCSAQTKSNESTK